MKARCILAISLFFILGYSGCKSCSEPSEGGKSRRGLSAAATWFRTYGGEEDDLAYMIEKTGRGEYILVGNTKSFGAGKTDVWLMKIDPEGNMIWEKTFGGARDDWAYSVLPTSDKGYILTGYAGSESRDITDIWIIKLDRDGNEEWNRKHSIHRFNISNSIVQTNDGGYMVAGSSGDRTSFMDFVVIRLDGGGEKIWSRTYGGGAFNIASSIIGTADGGYIVSGSTKGRLADLDFLVMKIDAGGERGWSRTFGGKRDDGVSSIRETEDGGYVAAGYTSREGSDYKDLWVLKLDSGCEKTWERTFGGFMSEEAGSIEQTADGGYIVAGYTQYRDRRKDEIWLIRLDPDGNMTWDRIYGGEKFDSAASIQRTDDGGYIVAGNTTSYGAGKMDMLVMKLDSEGGCPGCFEGPEEPDTGESQ